MVVALLISTSTAACRPGTAPEEPDEEAYSVVVCGHLYSLYVRSKLMSRRELIHSEDYLEAFADELKRIQPRAVFFLGDNTRFASEPEWNLLERAFSDVKAELIFVPGNHDHRDISTFEKAGGVRRGSFVFGRNKYVVLDTNTIYEEEHLEYLADELSDWESYDNVFLMMHYILAQGKEPEPGIESPDDPFERYSGTSNWNSKVLPLIAGKVKYVFIGDYYPLQAGRLVQHYQDHEVQFIRNSFLFARGSGDESTGDGPMLYLELRFQGDELSILPRALPVDLSAPWYENFNIPPQFRAGEVEELKRTVNRWRRHNVNDVFTLPLPPRWIIQRGQNGALLSGHHEPSGIGLRVYDYELSPAMGLVEFESSLLKRAGNSGAEELSIERQGALKVRSTPARWMISAPLRSNKTGRALNICFLYGEMGYLITCPLPVRQDDYKLEVADLHLLFRVVEAIKFDK